MEKHEVIPAFDILLEEINGIVSDLNQQGAQLIKEMKYTEARKLISKTEFVTSLNAKLKELREDCLRIDVPSTQKPKNKKKPVKRTITKMLKQGLRTPNDAFHLPILQALVQLGGSGQVQKVLDLVEQMMKDQLNKYDYQSIPSNPIVIRWRQNANWARWQLVQDGLLASDSQRGVWKITDEGRQRVAEASVNHQILAEKPIPYDDQLQLNATKDSISFELGKIYHRQHDLHDRYGGNRQSGITPCAEHPFIFLFTSPGGDEFGYQDGWISEDMYRYTGEGQMGDMEMVRGNHAIRNHQEDGRELHLFKKVDTSMYEYIGQFDYLKHEIRKGFDFEQRQREVIQFVLKRVDNK